MDEPVYRHPDNGPGPFDPPKAAAAATDAFCDYQRRAHQYAVYSGGPAEDVPPDVRRLALMLYPAGKLAGEAGEVVQKMCKLYRDHGIWDTDNIPDEKKLAVAKELGGCLWYIAEIATQLQMSLADVAQMNLQQLEGRKERGTLLGDGDDR